MTLLGSLIKTTIAGAAIYGLITVATPKGLEYIKNKNESLYNNLFNKDSVVKKSNNIETFSNLLKIAYTDEELFKIFAPQENRKLVFVPIDAAFDQIDPQELKALENDIPKLRIFLMNHVIDVDKTLETNPVDVPQKYCLGRRVCSSCVSVLTRGNLTTMNGNILKITTSARLFPRAHVFLPFLMPKNFEINQDDGNNVRIERTASNFYLGSYNSCLITIPEVLIPSVSIFSRLGGNGGAVNSVGSG